LRTVGSNGFGRPQIERLDRLHVVMPVHEHGRPPGWCLFFATTAGCPPVGMTLASNPRTSVDPTHAAQRAMSSLCSGFVLTLAIDRNSLSAASD
jgi:hypothetical protein